MKRIINVLTVVAVMVFAGYNVHKAQQHEVLSDVAMANVEALAQYENPNISYGYGLVFCRDADGRIIGTKCELFIPSAECNRNSIWGNCY